MRFAVLLVSLFMTSCRYSSYITEAKDMDHEKCFRIIKETPLNSEFKEVYYVDTCK